MAMHCHLETKLKWGNHVSSSIKSCFKQLNISQTIQMNQTLQRTLLLKRQFFLHLALTTHHLLSHLDWQNKCPNTYFVMVHELSMLTFTKLYNYADTHSSSKYGNTFLNSQKRHCFVKNLRELVDCPS